jgi:hypothetical protein
MKINEKTKMKVNFLVLTFSMKIYFLNCKYAVANILNFYLVFLNLFVLRGHRFFL